MLFRKTITLPVDPRPHLQPPQLAAHVGAVIRLTGQLVFHSMTVAKAKALGGLLFRGQEGFCAQLADGVLHNPDLHDPDTITRAQLLKTAQDRAWEWHALAAIFSNLARQAALSHIAEQAEANRQGLALRAAIERRMLDDYRAAQATGQADAVRTRNECIVDSLAPATIILAQNQRRVREHRAKLRAIRAADQTAGRPRRPRKRSTIAALTAQEQLQREFAAVRNA